MYSFKELHQQQKILLLTNVWDVPSATAAAAFNAQAIGTSSGAIASALGYADGEEIPFSELLYIVGRIAHSTKLPLSVDLEAGYGNTVEQIVDNIRQLVDLGVQGINIEDSLVVAGKRSLRDGKEFAALLKSIVQMLKEQGILLFINVRIDTFILEERAIITATKDRIRQYEAAGADGIFLPCLTDPSSIKSLVACTDLPINLMAMPSLPAFDQLQALGVKRLSMGDFLFKKVQQDLQHSMQTILQEQSFTSIF
ncbi:MAG: isocitrate lyase/PEP mutase family protein [Aureispira sp.]